MFGKSFLAWWPFDVNAGVNMKAIFWLGIMVLTQISRSHLKHSKKKINSFSQRISKIDGKRKFRRFDVVLKLEFEVKNW